MNQVAGEEFLRRIYRSHSAALWSTGDKGKGTCAANKHTHIFQVFITTTALYVHSNPVKTDMKMDNVFRNPPLVWLKVIMRRYYEDITGFFNITSELNCADTQENSRPFSD